MATTVRSFSKINLGLAVGPPRGDGFHGLTTLYQTLALHDLVTVSARRAAVTEIVLTANHPGVPRTETGDGERNTAYRIVAGSLARLGVAAAVTIRIEKRLPVQGGMGAGSANAAAALIGLERELGMALSGAARLELAAEVGSDVPLFLLGGTVLGLGRGERVFPMPDLPQTWCVVAVPSVGVSTRLAFEALDKRGASEAGTRERPQGLKPSSVAVLDGTAEAVPLQGEAVVGQEVAVPLQGDAVVGQEVAMPLRGESVGGRRGSMPLQGEANPGGALTFAQGANRLEQLSRVLAGVFTTSGMELSPTGIARTASPAIGSEPFANKDIGTAHDLAETQGVRFQGQDNTLLALVRTGIENDFEEVAFSQHPFLRDILRQLMGTDSVAPALYAALSGSGSALFGLYAHRADAEAAQQRVQSAGTQALLTETLPREAYWSGMVLE